MMIIKLASYLLSAFTAIIVQKWLTWGSVSKVSAYLHCFISAFLYLCTFTDTLEQKTDKKQINFNTDNNGPRTELIFIHRTKGGLKLINSYRNQIDIYGDKWLDTRKDNKKKNREQDNYNIYVCFLQKQRQE